MPAGWVLQDGYDVRLEWGRDGAAALGSVCATMVVVDVLRFTTTVDVAVSAGLAVVPCDRAGPAAAELARSLNATLADGRVPGLPSLSPASLSAVPAGSTVVLPSPNGASCALAAAETGRPVVAACLRNAAAVAAWLEDAPRPIAVIASGERWPSGSLRPGLEDLLGAAAIVARLSGTRSPEAEAAARLWSGVRRIDLTALLETTASGRELAERDLGGDVRTAAALDVSKAVPVLEGGRFVEVAERPSAHR